MAQNQQAQGSAPGMVPQLRQKLQPGMQMPGAPQMTPDQQARVQQLMAGQPQGPMSTMQTGLWRGPPPGQTPQAGAPPGGAAGFPQGGPGPGMQELLSGAGGPPKGAPGLGAGGGKGQQIANLQGGPGAPMGRPGAGPQQPMQAMPGAAMRPPPGALRRPAMPLGAPGAGAGGQKAQQMAQLQGGPR